LVLVFDPKEHSEAEEQACEAYYQKKPESPRASFAEDGYDF